MDKFYGFPVFNSGDFMRWTNESGQYEMVINASDLRLAPGELPYREARLNELDGIGGYEAGDYMFIRSHRTDNLRLFKLEERSASGWYFRGVSDSNLLVKIFND